MNPLSLWPCELFVIKARRRRRAGGHVKVVQRRVRTTHRAQLGTQSGIGFMQTFPKADA